RPASHPPNDPTHHPQLQPHIPLTHPPFNPPKRPHPHSHPTKQPTQTASKSFCRFRAAAVPRNRQTGSQGISRSAHLYKLTLGSFVVRSATLKKPRDRKSTRLNSSHVSISYAVFCLKKKNI